MITLHLTVDEAYQVYHALNFRQSLLCNGAAERVGVLAARVGALLQEAERERRLAALPEKAAGAVTTGSGA